MAFFTAKAKPLYTVTSGIDCDTIHELYELHCPWFFTGVTAPSVFSSRNPQVVHSAKFFETTLSTSACFCPFLSNETSNDIARFNRRLINERLFNSLMSTAGLPPTLLTHKIRSPRLLFHSCTTPRVSILILNWSMLLLPFTTDMPAGLELISTLISRCRYPAQTETPPRPEYRGTPPFRLSQRKGHRRVDLSRNRQSFLTTFSALLHCATLCKQPSTNVLMEIRPTCLGHSVVSSISGASLSGRRQHVCSVPETS